MFSGNLERDQWHEMGKKLYLFWNIWSFFVEYRGLSKNEFMLKFKCNADFLFISQIYPNF